ncbi:hypothetical protein FKM82_026747 [Ascaphus truei]
MCASLYLYRRPQEQSLEIVLTCFQEIRFGPALQTVPAIICYISALVMRKRSQLYSAKTYGPCLPSSMAKMDTFYAGVYKDNNISTCCKLLVLHPIIS